jgi:hypothetical protein
MRRALNYEFDLSKLRQVVLVFLLLMLGIVGFQTIVPVKVSAASLYDDAIKLTNSLKLGSPTGEVDVTGSFAPILGAGCGNTIKNSFLTAVNNGGDYAILNYDENAGMRIRLVWSEDPNTITAQFARDSPSVQYLYVTGTVGYAQFGKYAHNGNAMCDYSTTPTYMNLVLTSASFLASDEGMFANTFAVNYPIGYEGLYAPTGSVDHDGDGLTTRQELMQGTSDADMDTDKDGLSDYIESQWNSNRNDVFCKTSVTPHVCAYPDPNKQDVYVEVDWMNDGIISYKPTNTQLNSVINMFDDKGINLHFDIGDFGGGNQLSTYTSTLLNQSTSNSVDYYDYKSGGDNITANFSSNRASIWHYMIAGNKFTNSTTPSDSSGWAEVMASNIFVSIGRVREMVNSSWEDKAISNTIAHEIGHNLCLTTNRVYNELPQECVFEGIDNSDENSDYYDLENYESVMNYRYQILNGAGFGATDYSEGNHSTNDHNDWDAVHKGLGKFNIPRTLYVEFGARGSNISPLLSPDGNVIIEN